MLIWESLSFEPFQRKQEGHKRTGLLGCFEFFCFGHFYSEKPGNRARNSLVLMSESVLRSLKSSQPYHFSDCA